jgi:hypothetical protein
LLADKGGCVGWTSLCFMACTSCRSLLRPGIKTLLRFNSFHDTHVYGPLSLHPMPQYGPNLPAYRNRNVVCIPLGSCCPGQKNTNGMAPAKHVQLFTVKYSRPKMWHTEPVVRGGGGIMWSTSTWVRSLGKSRTSCLGHAVARLQAPPLIPPCC